MFKSIIIMTVYVFFGMQSKSYAYLDPGTGSIILQALLGFFAAAGASIVIYWKKLKSFLSKTFKTKRNRIE